MRLPNPQLAIVERLKIADYLLNPIHPDNGGKASFFASLGFAPQDWEIFAEALRQLALNAPDARRIESEHGQKYVLDGQIHSPCGRMPHVRTIWIIDRGSQAPRLVTAYPHGQLETP